MNLHCYQEICIKKYTSRCQDENLLCKPPNPLIASPISHLGHFSTSTTPPLFSCWTSFSEKVISALTHVQLYHRYMATRFGGCEAGLCRGPTPGLTTVV